MGPRLYHNFGNQWEKLLLETFWLPGVTKVLQCVGTLEDSREVAFLSPSGFLFQSRVQLGGQSCPWTRSTASSTEGQAA